MNIKESIEYKILKEKIDSGETPVDGDLKVYILSLYCGLSKLESKVKKLEKELKWYLISTPLSVLIAFLYLVYLTH